MIHGTTIMVVSMEESTMELVPDENRAIRERLGLSQAAAGRLLGGGPSAFTKYEAGTLRPAASLVNLLRVLEANPAARSEERRVGEEGRTRWSPDP